ncbi:BTB and TAZ domain protein 3 isoform 1 [Hibiscus syriacus]|uniref:BTB and TAZ domain protein 3 isoform 1 n=1 Tax=Hibiscus syriacus TaxID=106335 RepID=A0A6A3BI76_HIBSY|nr:pre-mRNA-splicing factor CWC25 homolog isoform X1 [Hibiscus syriacus]XP_039071031.1 pre-mRNA-splicing factor CWC25 homolog isoform X1 [Hibiscus syriacus]KAE8714459.1 BTB and TAZ domain protein 3 isoform 1 [Hibiscus syriacus]
MALKFLNKKGWHTGSLRNIENVWKAEQKHEAEQKKLEELRKQIHEERERSEFRLLQEQAGLVPKQERLDFLYDSGLAVGKGASSSAAGGSGAGFKALEEALPSSKATDSSANQSSAPGALFEDKPHSANDAWRKLHSDPLLMIRQREQEALARIKNNPVQMAMIRKSVVEKKKKEKSPYHKEHRKMHQRSSSKQRKLSSHHSDSEDDISKEDKRNRDRHHKRSDNEGRYQESDSEELKEAESREKSFRGQKYRYDDQDDVKRNHYKSKRDKYSSQAPRSIEADKSREKDRPAFDYHKRSDKEGNYRRIESDSKDELKEAESREKNRCRQKYEYDDRDDGKRNHDKSKHDKYSSQAPRRIEADKNQEKDRPSSDHRDTAPRDNRRRGGTSKLSEEERAARLREMQEDAELHEEQRWKRLKKEEENDAREATVSSTSTGRNFLDAAHKSIYGAEMGGSSTIEESVRRRAHYSQGRYESERNAFRR